MLSNQTEIVDDGGTADDMDNFLTAEEAAVLAVWSDEQRTAYWAATVSYEAMAAYLADPATPPTAKELLNLNGWHAV